MRKCTTCKAELEEGAIFCDECGTKVVLAHQGVVCVQCGTEIPAGQMFCGNCGVKIKIIYPPRKCSHCGHKWVPRKANPKFCPGCGYNLSRDNVMEVLQMQDVGDGMQFFTCSECGKKSRLVAKYRKVGHMPGEAEAGYKYECYVCIMKGWIEVLKRETDMIEDSFDTGELNMEELEERLAAEEVTLAK